MNPSSSYSYTLGGVQDAPQALSLTTEPHAEPGRCTWALAYGQFNWWHTRCDHTAGHPRMHGGVGQENWPHEYVQWYPGDANEHETTRDDVYAWYDPVIPTPLEQSPGGVTT